MIDTTPTGAFNRASVQTNARTIQLGLLVVAIGGLALWRPRIFSRSPA